MSGPPPVPSLGMSLAVIFRLSWIRLVRGKKLRVALVSVALVLLAVIAARYAQGAENAAPLVRQGIGLGFFNLLVYLLPFLLTSGAIAEEVESRTFHFVASRPVSRLAIVLGKYGAGVAMASAALAGGVLVLHLGCFLTDPTALVDELADTLRATGALILICALYGAICMFWGAVASEAAGIVSALYLAVMELGFGKLPFFLRFASLGFFGQELGGIERGGLLAETVPEVAPWIGAIVLPAFTLLWLWLAALVVSSSEYRFGRA